MSRLQLSLVISAALLLGAVVGAALWALGVDRVDSGSSEDVRISARRLAGGGVEVALQQRQADGWGQRRLPSARILPADAPESVWLHSSSLTLRTAPAACAAAPRSLRYGFFAHFEPISYSAESDPDAPGFHEHRGYEADLLSAVETMVETNLHFDRAPIATWPAIWLASAGPEFDLIGGGITILESRTRDADGRTVVAFTDGHVHFRQSLLVRAGDVERIRTHADLSGGDVVGAVPATTGEARLLQLVGLADAEGVLAAGVRIVTEAGELTADGSRDYIITAAFQSPALINRTRLIPPGSGMPQVVYLGGDESAYLSALTAGEIDAFARGEIGNSDAAHASNGAFTVTALDSAVELGGFTLDRVDTALRACLNERLNWLTDQRRLGYPDWRADPQIFNRRAQAWNDARSAAQR